MTNNRLNKKPEHIHLVQILPISISYRYRNGEGVDEIPRLYVTDELRHLF